MSKSSKLLQDRIGGCHKQSSKAWVYLFKQMHLYFDWIAWALRSSTKYPFTELSFWSAWIIPFVKLRRVCLKSKGIEYEQIQQTIARWCYVLLRATHESVCTVLSWNFQWTLNWSIHSWKALKTWIFPDVLSKCSSVGVMLGGVMEVMGHFLNVFVDQTGH